MYCLIRRKKKKTDNGGAVNVQKLRLGHEELGAARNHV